MSPDGRSEQPWRKIGFQLVAVILVCSLVPLGLTTYVAEGKAEAALEHKSVERQQTEVAGVASNAESRGEFYKQQIRIVRTHPAVQELIEYRYRHDELGAKTGGYERGAAYPALLDGNPRYHETLQFFGEVERQNPNVDMIRVFWRDGNVLAGNKLGAEDTRDFKADKSWFEATMDADEVGEDEVYVSAINIARATDSPAIRYAMPLTYNGERVGLVIINYRAAQITAPVTDMDLGEGGYGMLIDPGYTNAEGETIGAMYVANGRDRSLAFDEERAGDIALPEDELSGETGTFRYARDGTTYHATYQRLELGGKSYYAVAAVPVAEMLAASRSIRETSLLIAGVAGLAMLGVGVVVSRRYSRPIGRLAADASAVADGDLDREIRAASVAVELAAVTDSVRQMKTNVVDALDDAEAQQRAAERERESAEAFTRSLEETASEYERVMNRCADGDLTARLAADSESEAMNDIAAAFNAMVGDWAETVADLKAFADEVAASSTEVTASTREVQHASEEVSESTLQISEGANEQTESLDEVTSEMNDLSATVEEIASTVDTVADRSAETATRSEAGRESAEEAIEEMRVVEEKAAQSVAGVRQLDEEMEKIGEITEVITDITDQTNLLALNANIEAARAGEAGSGFAVVADEVKTLAEETKESAAEIATVIETVRQQSADTVSEIEETEARIAEGTETVAETVEALEDVASMVEETDVGVREIHGATDDQAVSTQEVVTMVEDIAAISEETTAEAETVAAASEEQTASLDEVAARTDDLAEQAAELQGMLEAFEVETGGGVSASGFDFEGTAVATDGGRD